MTSTKISPQNFPETLVWYYIIYTYVIYLLGAQYVLAMLLGTVLGIYTLKKWWNQTENTPLEERITISSSCWIWLIAVLIVEFSLIIGHLNFDLGFGQIIKSSINWYRNWGLFFLFPLAGHLNIRPELIYRSICILCFQSIFAFLICSVASTINLPIITYTSPLKAFGGNSDSYAVYLFYIIDQGQDRLHLFAPWAPALGLVGNIYFCLASQESNKKWRYLGMIGAIAMVLGSVSRLSMVCLPLIMGALWAIPNLIYPWLYFWAGSASLFIGMFAPTLIYWLESFKDKFNKARSGSSEIRARLARLAKEAWQNDAPIWGHGRLEASGTAFTANKPIGSHHFWYGTLYMHGLVGCIPIMFAFLWSFINLLLKAPFNKHAKAGLCIILIMLFFTFAENIDTLTYVIWPGLLLLGISFKQKFLSLTELNEQLTKPLSRKQRNYSNSV